MCDLVRQRGRGEHPLINLQLVFAQVFDNPGEDVCLKPLPPLGGDVRIAEQPYEPTGAAQFVASHLQRARWWNQPSPRLRTNVRSHGDHPHTECCWCIGRLDMQRMCRPAL